MKRALAQGAAVNSRNRLGESALIILLKKDRVDLAQLVLDAGADVNQPAVNGITPLMTAAFSGHTDMAETAAGQGREPGSARSPAKKCDDVCRGRGPHRNRGHAARARRGSERRLQPTT